MEQNHGSGLLLRLFESSFFSVHLAVAYLKTYPASIGITHYLVDRLRQFPADQVELYWSQLCYLAVTGTDNAAAASLVPTSRAIENFVYERCTQDPHIAVITLWYMQSTIVDWANAPQTVQFETCKRMYNRVQQLLYSDPPTPPAPPALDPATSTSNAIEGQPEWKPSLVYGNPQTDKVQVPSAALIGMGVMAGAVAQPSLAASTSKPMLLEQATLPLQASATNQVVNGIEEVSMRDSNESDEEPKEPQLVVNGQIARPSLSTKRKSTLQSSRTPSGKPSFLPGPRIEPSPSVASIPKTYSPNTASVTFLPSPSYTNGSLSVPSLPLSKSTPSLPSSSPQSISSLPEQYLAHLLVLQACRSQLDLIRSLEDISTRLIAVPKLARVSALRAELTVLNHGLPRGCCLCMHCSGSPFREPDTSSPVRPPRLKGRPHDRVIRIAPSESVVLNSADRAPFLVHVEVLEGDLDFDPQRRQNHEDLRRALGLSNEQNRSASIAAASGSRHVSRTSEGAIAMSSDASLSRTMTPPPFVFQDSTLPDEIDRTKSIPRSSPLKSPQTSQDRLENAPHDDREVPEQEMDLVEQLYGHVDFQMSTNELPSSPVIQNKSVDEQAWKRPPLAGSAPSSSSSAAAASGSALTNGNTSKRPSTVHPRPGGRTISSTRPTLSIDDYAERMRMAAIMLSQLDASQTASRGVVATGTAAVGTVVGLPKATVLGIGGVVGDAVGMLASRIVSGSSSSSASAASRLVPANNDQAGQASSGVVTKPDTTSATTITTDGPVPHHESSALVSTSASSSSSPLSLSTMSNKTATAANAAIVGGPQRHRVLAPADAQLIKDRIMTEMMALEEERMERMRLDGESRSVWAREQSNSTEDGTVVMRAVNKEDPSGAMVAESFESKKARIRAASPYGHLANWNVMSVIVKTGADLRQEQFAIQLVREFDLIWSEETCPHWVRFFRIMVTSESTGMIETITDAVSVHSIRKNAYAAVASKSPTSVKEGTPVAAYSMFDHFVKTYGEPTTSGFRRAQDRFMTSLASYSVISYLLQLKDRHNGNILIDKHGHVIHIDFGFLLSNTPGSIGFEMAPFKLPQEYIDILGGYESAKYREFKDLFKRLFRAARKHAERIITLVELMQKDSKWPCFLAGSETSVQLRERFALGLTQSQVDELCEKLIMTSATSTFTRLYDLFQLHSNGIL